MFAMKLYNKHAKKLEKELNDTLAPIRVRVMGADYVLAVFYEYYAHIEEVPWYQAVFRAGRACWKTGFSRELIEDEITEYRTPVYRHLAKSSINNLLSKSPTEIDSKELGEILKCI